MSIQAAQLARNASILDGIMNFSSCGILTWRQWIDLQASLGSLEPTTSNGMIDYSRTKFNRMDNRQQDAYRKQLEARRYYWINNIQVPKTVYDYALSLTVA